LQQILAALPEIIHGTQRPVYGSINGLKAIKFCTEVGHSVLPAPASEKLAREKLARIEK